MGEASGAAGFTIFPAIDLRHGQVVRLRQGRDDDTTVYGSDPLEVARSFEAAGARALHVVDLDAAFGDGNNAATIAAIARAVAMPVETGGGLRDDASVARVFDAGVRWAIIGSAAVESPEWVGRLVEAWGDRIVVGLDARNGEVRTRGWVEGSGRRLHDVGAQMRGFGVRRVIYTDIARDGMLLGPDVEGAVALAEATGLEVIASGGVGALDHLRAAHAARSFGVVGVVVGKALYEGRFGLAEALDAVSTEGA